MSRINFSKDFELRDGEVVETNISLNIIHSPNYGADVDGYGGMGIRILDGVDFHTDSKLTEAQFEELSNMVNKHVEFLLSDLCLVSEDV